MKTLPGGLDADRLRLRRPHRRRPPHRRREGERPHRPAALPAAERRLRRDPHLEAGPRARRATGSSLAASSRARNKIRQWFSRETREDTEQKGRDALEQALKAQNLPYREARGLGGARAGDPRDGLQEGRGLLPRARLREAAAGADRQQGDPAPEDGRGRRGGDRPAQGAEGADRRPASSVGISVAGRRGRARPAREVLHAGAGRRDRRLHLARQGHHDPPRGLPERAAR